MASMDFDQFMIHQLNNKFINQPVMIDRLIIEDIHNYNPQDFFSEANAGGTRECYILTPRHLLYGLVCRPDRRAGNGYWKALYTDGKICGMSGLLGVKQKLCFYEGDMNNGRKTNWRMIEYRLKHHVCSIACDHESGRLDSWVLCKLYENIGPEALSSEMERMDISDKESMNI